MALAVKPHTVTVAPVTEPVDSTTLEVSVPAAGSAVTVTGHLIPKTPAAAFNSHGVSLRRPFLFLMETSDAGSFAQGYVVTKGAKRFMVATDPLVFDADSAAGTDYASVMLDEEKVQE